MSLLRKLAVIWIVFIGAALAGLSGCQPNHAEQPEYPVQRTIEVDSYRKIYEVTIDGCQYLTATDINGNYCVFTHKGNCKNHSVSRQ